MKNELIKQIAPYLFLDKSKELMDILDSLPNEKLESIVGFIERLKKSTHEFKITEIKYEKLKRKLDVDAWFHLDSF
jgi:hypothetical protein